MTIGELINDLEIIELIGDDNTKISGIDFDSNKIKEGYLFVALKGDNTDGHNYINSAIVNGAKALLVENIPLPGTQEVAVIQVPDTRSALAKVSTNFFEHPTDELTLVGITGTNGKTTVTYLLESIWNAEKKKTGVIGTIDYRYEGKVVQSNMTTPESLDLMRMFNEMRNAGVKSVAMEVSSHALDKNRVAECQFDAAVFTNLTQDHLDYHHSMEEYFNVKKRLFSEFLGDSQKQKKVSVINIDDPYGARLARELQGNVVTYSIHNKEADVYPSSYEVTSDGISSNVHTRSGELKITSKMFGEHNLSNILASVATAVSLGTPIEAIEEGISNIPSVPGRLEVIANSQGLNVLVDYAHTPDALKNVLQAVKPLTKGDLLLVFGCGGDRDNAKRPQMGKIGKELSDILFVTSDNPRTEDPEIIIDHIESGVIEAGQAEKPYHRITDRREAIKQAINTAKKNDTILIAGKGHEDYQIIGTTKYPFDDRIIAREALSEL